MDPNSPIRLVLSTLFGAKLWPYLRLTRPPETLLVFVGTLIGAWLAGLEHQGHLLLIAVATSNMLLSAASMVINDWHDVAEDRINCPGRPIPAGDVPRRHAMVFFVGLFASAVLIAGLVEWRIGILTLLVSFLSIQYTLHWKKVPFWGNGIVALAFTYTFWCWIPLVGSLNATYVVLTLAFFVFSLGREVVKTGGDVMGDALCDVHTVATVWGVISAHRIGAGLICCGLVLGGFPILAGTARWSYVAILSLSMALSGLVWARTLWEPAAADPRSNERYLGIARWIQVLMAVAIVVGLRR